MEETTTKFRVEEHYKNSGTYLLHGIYNNTKSAINKIKKLVDSGIDKNNLFIIQITTTKKVIW